MRHQPGERVIDTLLDSTQGAYLVTTSDSKYLMDLDRMVILRFSLSEDLTGALLGRKDEFFTLVGVSECTVGRPMFIHIDLHVADVAFTAHGVSPVLSIEQVPSPGLGLSS